MFTSSIRIEKLTFAYGNIISTRRRTSDPSGFNKIIWKKEMHSGMAKTPLNRAIEGDSVKSLDSDGKAAIKTASFSRNPGAKLYSYIYEIGNAPTLQ